MFIERIEVLLSEKGVQKKTFLAELGLSKNSFVNWRDRGTIPSGATLQKIADYFHVPVESLTEEKPTPTGLPASGGVEVTPLEAELLAAYRRLSPAQRQALLALLGIESQP